LAGVLKDEKLAKGGEEAMAEVGKWGIREARGK
jgi:intermediate peptidase